MHASFEDFYVSCSTYHLIYNIIINLQINIFLSRQEDNKNYEKYYQDKKYFNHEPSIWGDTLEIFKELGVSSLNIQIYFSNIGINSV